MSPVHHMNMNLLYRSLRRGTQLTRGFPEEHNGEKLCKDSQESFQENDGSEYISIKGVILDMDGTMTLPVLDFIEMRKRIGIPLSVDIMAYINSLENEEKKSHAISIIESMEEEAHHKLKLQPGLQELLSFLEENQIRKALLTRNNSQSVDIFLKTVKESLINSTCHPNLLSKPIFEQILTRDFKPHKPSPAPVLHICTQWSLPPHNVLVVGDDKVDVLSGHNAGSVTALLLNKEENGVIPEPPEDCPYDVIVTSLNQLLDLLKKPFDVFR